MVDRTSFFSSDVICPRRATLAEVALIALTFFCLPVFEAPKNVFSILFLLVWTFEAARKFSLGEPSPFGLPITGLAAVLWVSPLFSEFGAVITPINSAPRWTLLALFSLAAARLNYTKTQVMILWGALILGGVFAVAESLHAWSLNAKPYPEFRSVGHVNHSSMYTLITLAASCGALIAPHKSAKFIGLLGILSTLAFLPPSKSIVGAVAISSVLIFWAALVTWGRHGWRSFLCLAMCVSVLVSVTLLTPAAEGFREEFFQRISGDNLFSGRDRILNSALAVWGKHPIIGTGWFSFGMVTSSENVQAALMEQGRDYSPHIYWHFPHGHNLWVTMLIERGLFGVVVVSFLLAIYFRTFIPIASATKNFEPVDRCVAVSATLVATGFTVAGLGNTTMMNEHGHAGMALIAVSYGYLRGQRYFCP
jgi:O-antigen ligase